MRQVFLVILSLTALQGSAWAARPVLPDDTGSDIPGKWKRNWLFVWDDTYRIGDEWGKKPVTAEQLKKESAGFVRAAQATGRVGGGTTFFLGKFDGVYVSATNYHVMETASGCKGKTVTYPWLDLKVPCETFLGSWSDVDLALFTLKLTPEQAEKLEAVGANFKFDAEIYPGQELLTIGFGVADNPFRAMVANQDSDCKVFSAKDEFRFMADPDELNPGPYKAWSFANGCDVSHGDSGSAMIDRKTGDVVGIIWTGRIPKDKKVQSSKYLQTAYEAGDKMIWEDLSYSVPAPKMKEHLQTVVDSDKTPELLKSTLKDILATR